MLEPIVFRGREREILVAELGEREKAELLETVDIDLGKLRKFFAGVDSILIGIEAFDRHRRIEFIERPAMPKPDDTPLFDQYGRLDVHPDVRVSLSRLNGPRGHCCGAEHQGNDSGSC